MECLKNLLSKLFSSVSGVSRTQRVLRQFVNMRDELDRGVSEIALEQSNIEERIQRYRDKIVRLHDTNALLGNEVAKARDLSDGLAKLLGNAGD